jgi:hypothetical protein
MVMAPSAFASSRLARTVFKASRAELIAIGEPAEGMADAPSGLMMCDRA